MSASATRVTHEAAYGWRSYVTRTTNAPLVTVELGYTNGADECLRFITVEEATTIRDLLTYAIRDAEENRK